MRCRQPGRQDSAAPSGSCSPGFAPRLGNVPRGSDAEKPGPFRLEPGQKPSKAPKLHRVVDHQGATRCGNTSVFRRLTSLVDVGEFEKRAVVICCRATRSVIAVDT